jgi:hypothetical protein
VDVAIEGGGRAEPRSGGGVWLCLIPYGPPARARFLDAGGEEVASESVDGLTAEEARRQGVRDVGALGDMLGPKRTPRAHLRVERGSGVLRVVTDPEDGRLALLHDYPDAHGATWVWPEADHQESLEPGEGWTTAFGPPPAGARRAEAVTAAGRTLDVFLAPGRA